MNILRILSLLQFLPAAIALVENKDLTGEQKKKIVIEEAKTVAAVAVGPAQNDGLLHDGLSKTVDGIVDILNSTVWHKP